MDTQNALTDAQIKEWKDKYHKVYKTVVGDQVIVWRKLTRKEYVKVMTEVDDDNSQIKVYLRQDAITQMVTLYPKNIAQVIEENGTLSSAIADEIMMKSGFDVASTAEL